MGTYSITPTVAEGMIGGSTSYAEALGASPKILIYSGAPPANAAASIGSAVLLATLVAAATPISGVSDTGTAGRATWAAIASSAAVATGTASFFRTMDNAAAVVKDQGSVGTSSADCILNTVAVTAGSTMSITARTNDLPYGP